MNIKEVKDAFKFISDYLDRLQDEPSGGLREERVIVSNAIDELEYTRKELLAVRNCGFCSLCRARHAKEVEKCCLDNGHLVTQNEYNALKEQFEGLVGHLDCMEQDIKDKHVQYVALEKELTQANARIEELEAIEWAQPTFHGDGNIPHLITYKGRKYKELESLSRIVSENMTFRETVQKMHTEREESVEKLIGDVLAAITHTYDNEAKAISKGSSPYGEFFFQAALGNNIINAIRNVFDDPKNDSE